MLVAFLQKRGHDVVTATNGEIALRTYDDTFDWVVTDYQMPRKNGVVLITDIRRSNPTKKCLLVSADPPQLTAAVRADAGEFPMLSKPFDSAELIALLSENSY